MLLLGDRSGRGSDFDPIACELEKEVDQFTHSEHRSSEYEAQRSTDITQQSETRVRSLRLHLRVPHLRVKYLHDQPSASHNVPWQQEYMAVNISSTAKPFKMI